MTNWRVKPVTLTDKHMVLLAEAAFMADLGKSDDVSFLLGLSHLMGTTVWL